MSSFYQDIAKQHQSFLILPKKKLIHQFIDELFSVLFSNTSKYAGSLPTIESKFKLLEKEFNDLVLDFEANSDRSQQQTKTFFEALPSIHRQALNDAETIFAKDPAANTGHANLAVT